MTLTRARCHFCNLEASVRWSKAVNNWVFVRHSHGGAECAGSYSYAPPGLPAPDEEGSDAED